MISIIIPLYNKSKTIFKSVDSVVSQTYSDWELLVINDGSNDGSEIIVQKYLKDNRIKLFNKQNGGVSSARNEGLRHAHGEWILFLDADDYLMPDALELYAAAINKRDAFIIVSDFYMSSKGKQNLVSFRKKDGVINNYVYKWIKGDIFPRCGTTLFNVSVVNGHSFDEQLSRNEDTKFTLEVLHGHHIHYIARPLMVYDQDNLSLSRNYIFKKDFVSRIMLNEYSFWERVFLSKFIKIGLDRYVQEQKTILESNPNYHFYYTVFCVIYYFNKIRRNIINSI